MRKEALKNHFLQYADSFLTGNEEVDINLQLKKDHTLRVVAEAEALARAESFQEEEIFLLFCSALLHDLSRFEQFVRFQTFDDTVSFDHGERSFELLQGQGFPGLELTESERQIILTAVRYHNKRTVPENLSPAERKILLAVRDADKTDIMNILLEHLKNPVNSAIVYKLPDQPGLSAEVAAALLAGTTPAHADLKTGLDFLAAKLTWGFDLNYCRTCREFLRREYLQKLRHALPEKPEVLDICLERVLMYMQKKGNM
jgi:hypothetical protein